MPDSTPADSTPVSSPTPSANAPELPFGAVLGVLSNPLRWRILRELVDGPMLNSELADRCQCTRNAISKHIALLIDAGIVIAPRVRLFEIAPRFLADKSQRLLDLGYCVLRLNSTP